MLAYVAAAPYARVEDILARARERGEDIPPAPQRHPGQARRRQHNAVVHQRVHGKELIQIQHFHAPRIARISAKTGQRLVQTKRI